MGEHDDAKRQHPESDNGKKTENTARDQSATQNHARHTVARHRHMNFPQLQTTRLVIDAISALRLVFRHVCFLLPWLLCPQEMGT